MTNNSWSSKEYEGWLTLTHLKSLESIMFSLKDIKNITEEVLQSNYADMLSDREIMLAFKILLKYNNV